jgi:non-heme chloroperoxidase
MSTHFKFFVAYCLLLLGCTATFAGQYVRVSPDLELYYNEAGSGRPLIFITGWTGANESFAQDQFPYFSKKYRVIAYDPRAQGRSSKTLEGHNYIQHGKDLRAFMEGLKLKDPILVGWSNGCTDIYGYFRTYSTDNVKAFVCIDQSPRQHRAEKGDWGDFNDVSELAGFINGAAYDRPGLMKEFLPTMLQRKITQEEINWSLDTVRRTPDYVAVLLGVDGSLADYTPEMKAIDGKIPVLNFVSDAQAQSAKAWLAKNAPHSEIFVLGNHWMFHEFPDKFNAVLDGFLAKVK